MPRNKENTLFEKIVKKDYKNELEEVLEKKNFGENAKSLLLEILYKIEIAYKDYEKVKIGVAKKEEYIENFIDIIQNKCKTIKIVKPNSEESLVLNNKTFFVSKERSEIICLPIARKLLYAIAKISKEDIIVNKKYSLLSTTMSNLINVGHNINMVEPLRDFNGWSWTTVPREYESIEYNLIYQLLTMLAGEKFLSDWTKSKDSIIDYLDELEEVLTYRYGENLSKKIIEIVEKLSVIMDLKVNADMENEIEKAKERLERELTNLGDKEEYIKRLTAQKNKLKSQIMNIDTILSDQDLLQEEYIKRNQNLPLEEKIFSMRVLAETMMLEREKLFEKLQKCNELLKPQKFLEKRQKLENEYEIYELADVENIENELKDNLIKLQKLFLECFKIKVDKAQEKHQIINLIYQYRYYCALPYDLTKNNFELDKIQEQLEQTGKKLIRKAIEQRVLFIFAKNENLNYKIIKNIFNVRSINLEDLSIKIIKENDEFYVQFFDDKAFDKKCKLDFETLNKKELKIRLNKKIKVFE